MSAVELWRFLLLLQARVISYGSPPAPLSALANGVDIVLIAGLINKPPAYSWSPPI
jgi:hypothetical protein